MVLLGSGTVAWTYWVGAPVESRCQQGSPSFTWARWMMAMQEKMISAVICTTLIAAFTPVVPPTPRKAMYDTPNEKAMQNRIMNSGLGTVGLKVDGKSWPSMYPA